MTDDACFQMQHEFQAESRVRDPPFNPDLYSFWDFLAFWKYIATEDAEIKTIKVLL